MLHEKNHCIDCTKRVVGCHSVCEDYKAFKENLANQNKLKEEDKQKRRLIDNYFFDRKRSLCKSTNKIKYTKER